MWLRNKYSINVLILIGLFFLSGCQAQKDTVYISVPSSMEEGMKALAQVFETENTDTQVILNVGGTSTLKQQLIQGAPVDLFFSASQAHFDELVQLDKLKGGAYYISNQAVIITNQSNQRIHDYTQLTDPQVQIVLAKEEVPIGAYSQQLLEALEQIEGNHFKDLVNKQVVSWENNVRQVLIKVALGEVDAGIVYQTDCVLRAEDVIEVPLPEGIDIKADYYIGYTEELSGAAEEFYSLAVSDLGKEIFESYGFLKE